MGGVPQMMVFAAEGNQDAAAVAGLVKVLEAAPSGGVAAVLFGDVGGIGKPQP